LVKISPLAVTLLWHFLVGAAQLTPPQTGLKFINRLCTAAAICNCNGVAAATTTATTPTTVAIL